ncbi:MAG: class I SAM-dependent methyltransferase [Ilumatobacteraceae bacterium]
MSAPLVPNAGFEYYRDRYWNDFEIVVQALKERATGDPSVSWFEHLRDTAGPFRHALVLNCGNGWVERELLERGVVASAVGVDVSDDLLDEARRAADERDLPLRYERLDTNAAEFPDEGFDLVVNHAAMHHVAYIDRVTRRIHELLTRDGVPHGVYVSWDYVGPHRNQYTARQWEAAWEANLRLPPEARQRMRYPLVPAMLGGDPTEAIHSELILVTTERYFDIEHRRDLGGGVGYLLLTHNEAIHALAPDEAAPHVEAVMAADAELLAADPSTSLFAYLVTRPRAGALDDAEQLAAWSAEEDERERAAAAAGGIYYPRTAIAALAEQLGGLTADAHGDIAPDELLARVPGRSILAVLVLRVRVRLALAVQRVTGPCQKVGRRLARLGRRQRT